MPQVARLLARLARHSPPLPSDAREACMVLLHHSTASANAALALAYNVTSGLSTSPNDSLDILCTFCALLYSALMNPSVSLSSISPFWRQMSIIWMAVYFIFLSYDFCFQSGQQNNNGTVCTLLQCLTRLVVWQPSHSALVIDRLLPLLPNSGIVYYNLKLRYASLI